MRDSFKIMLVCSYIEKGADDELHPPEQLGQRHTGQGLGKGVGVTCYERIELPGHLAEHEWLRVRQVAADKTDKGNSTR